MSAHPGGKFDWVWHLGRDARLSYADRYILTITALKSVGPRDLTFCIRQKTIAENCAASEATVRRALAAGRRLGYIELVAPRKRGRGNHGADAYRLVLPPNEIPSRVTSISDTKYRSPATKIEVTGDENRGQVQLSDQRELHPPLGLLEVSRRCAADAAPPAESSPDPYCPAHMPNGTDAKCRACGKQRVLCEQHEAERDRQEREARRRAREDCNICGGNWYVLGADLIPVEPLIRCPVCKPAQAVVG